jgi:hypothetical protein
MYESSKIFAIFSINSEAPYELQAYFLGVVPSIANKLLGTVARFFIQELVYNGWKIVHRK